MISELINIVAKIGVAAASSLLFWVWLGAFIFCRQDSQTPVADSVNCYPTQEHKVILLAMMLDFRYSMP